MLLSSTLTHWVDYSRQGSASLVYPRRSEGGRLRAGSNEMLSQTEARGVSSSPRGSWAEAGSNEMTSIAKKCDPEPM